MSETSILPGAGSATQSDANLVPPGTDGGETESGGDRRRMMIIGGVAGVVVLGAAAYMLLHGGSSSSTQTFTPTHVTQSPPAPAGRGGSGNGSGHGTKPTTLPKKAKQPAVRDPFKALVEAPVTTTGTAPSTTTKVSAAPTGFPPVAPVAPVAPPTSGTGNPPTSGGSTSGAPQWIQLKRVHGDFAVFDVGYAHHRFRRYEVQAPPPGSQQGTVFDKIFALIGIQNDEVTVQIGDDTPFDLTRGVSHVV